MKAYWSGQRLISRIWKCRGFCPICLYTDEFRSWFCVNVNWLEGTKACAGCYIVLVRKRPTFFITEDFCWNGMWHCFKVSVSVTPPKSKPPPPTDPLLLLVLLPPQLRFTLVAVGLRSLVGHRLDFGRDVVCFGRGVLHFSVSFSAIILYCFTTVGQTQQSEREGYLVKSVEHE